MFTKDLKIMNFKTMSQIFQSNAILKCISLNCLFKFQTFVKIGPVDLSKIGATV